MILANTLLSIIGTAALVLLWVLHECSRVLYLIKPNAKPLHDRDG